MVTERRTAPFWKERERAATDNSATKAQLLDTVLEHMPAGPFSSFDFLNTAIGLNAVSNASEIEGHLQRLVQAGMIYRDGSVFERISR
ncbi:MAG: hypothetical protein JWN99_986 [Ilumatobacteraceae bacterium]|nr:hypothetical protein [Ilumatobacteraceae bacterium]